MKDKSSELRSLFERALEDTLPLDEARSFMSKVSEHDDQIIQWAAHLLIHYLDDADLRERDPEYDTYMRSEALSLIKQLETL